MFVLSMKTTRLRLVVGGAAVCLLLALTVAGGRRSARVQGVTADGADATRVAYLQERGYAVEPQWTDVREVVASAETIPAAYRGKRLKCFTYATAEGDTVCLYECDGKIIGMDKGIDYGTIG